MFMRAMGVTVCVLALMGCGAEGTNDDDCPPGTVRSGGACVAPPRDSGTPPPANQDSGPPAVPDSGPPAVPDSGPPPAPMPEAIPFAVDDWFGPSGYMGDGSVEGAVVDEAECPASRPGDAAGNCHRFTWTPAGEGWAGVFWQYPDGSWGEVPGLQIPAGATKVEFYAWGQLGGEVVKFGTGMGDVDGFAIEQEVVLTTEPTVYTLDISQVDYTAVTGGFVWTAADAEAAVTFFVDDIQWK